MILINTSFELKKKTGIGVYILTLIKALQINKINYSTTCLDLPKWVRFTSIFQFVWLNTYIYLISYLKSVKIFLSPSFIMPYFKFPGTKYVTVIHDLCPYRDNEMLGYSKYIYSLATELTVKKADTIITVSQTIKNELIAKFNISPERIKVVHNAIADYFINFEDKPKLLEKYNIENKKYILSVATLNKRKNIPELIKAFESISNKYPDLKLLLVGGMGNEQKEKLTRHSNIIFAGYVKDEEIPILYKHALMYIFPSLYEGFGTPIMEAQYSGTPLICSDIPVFREIAGDGAEFCSTDSKGIAEKIEFLINNPQRCEELIKSGNKNVKRFDIEKIAEQLREVINKYA